MKDKLVYLFIRVIDASLFVWCMDRSFTRRYKGIATPILIFAMLYVADISFFTNLLYDVRLLIMMLATVMIGYLFYVGDKVNVTATCLLLHCVFFSSTLLQVLVSYAIRDREPVYAYEQDIVSIVLIICSRAALCAMLFGLKDKSMIQLITERRRWQYLFFSGCIWLGLLLLSAAFRDFKLRSLLLVLSFGLLSAGVVSSVFLLSSMAKRHIELSMESQDKERTESENRYLMRLLQGQESIRELQHDMREHMKFIAGMARRGEDDKLLKYLDALQKEDTETDVINTGNTEIDIMINDYIIEAEKANAVCSITACMTAMQDLDSVSICSIISNMWRNAIEGCESSQRESTFIIFKLQQSDSVLSITMINTSADKRQQGLQSLKNGLGHGFGTRSIRRSAEKMGGTAEFIPHEDRFEVRVTLPMVMHEGNRLTVSSYRTNPKG